jgi:hypothetical protein
MDQLENLGRWLLIVGLCIAAIGGFIWFGGRIPLINKLGQLPGDLRFTSPDGSFGCFVPIVSSIILSIVLTIVLNVVIRLMNR